MKRALGIVLLLLLALLLVLAVAWWWLTMTTAGTNFVLGQLSSRIDGLRYGHRYGTLRGGLGIEQLELRQGGFSVTAESVALQIKTGLWPPRVELSTVGIDGLVIELPEPPEEPATEAIALGDWRAPIPVEVGELIVRDLTLKRAGQTLFVLERIDGGLTWDSALHLNGLQVRHAEGTFRATGRVGLDAPWPVQLAAELGLEAPGQRLALDLEGRLPALVARLDGSGPLTATGELRLDGLPDPARLEGRLQLSGQLADWPGIDGRIEALTLTVEGRPERWTAALEGRVSWPGLPAAGVALQLNGDPGTAQLQSLEVDALDGTIHATGQLAYATDTAWAEAHLELQDLDFTGLYPDWQQQARLGGALDLRYDGRRLAVRNLQLHAPPTPMVVTGQAEFDTVSEQLAVDLGWQSLRWPPVLDPLDAPLVASREGRLTASGRLDEWRAELEGWLRWLPEQPESRIELEGTGDQTSARIDALRIDMQGGGMAELDGRIDWRDEPAMVLNGRVSNFDPGAFVSAFPGRINGEVGVAVHGLAPRSATLRIHGLDGRLRGHPLSGEGSLSWSPDAPGTADLELGLGQNRLQLTGAAGRPWRLDLHAGDLAQLWPGLDGQLTANAVLDQDRLEWTIDAPDLGWGGRRIHGLIQQGDLALAADWSAEVTTRADQVRLNPWREIDGLEWRLSGACGAHRIEASMSVAGAEVALALQSAFESCSQPGGWRASAWRGQLERLALRQTPVGDWQLDQPVQFGHVPGSGLSVDQGCLWTEQSPARLCLNTLVLAPDGAGHTALAMSAVPVDMLLLPLDPAFSIASTVGGRLRLAWDPTGLQAIDGVVVAGPGVTRMLGAPEPLLGLRGAEIRMVTPEPRTVRINGELAFGEQGQFVLDATLSGLDRGAQTGVAAELRMAVPRLAVFNPLIPQLDELSGRLDGRLTASGHLAGPAIQGALQLSDGRVWYAPLGLRVQGLQATLTGMRDRFDLEGRFQAGSGEGTVRGRLEPGASGWVGTVGLTGSRLVLANVDWLQLTASPELELRLANDQTRLGGDLVIDQARIGLPPGAEARVTPSPDVVVVGRSEASVPEAPVTRPLALDLNLILGDPVLLDAAGLEARLAGRLHVDWPQGASLPRGDGTIRITEGSYRIYGQNLDVTEGRVEFGGRPIDDPVISVRAVREIFGDPQVQYAGVTIEGTARQPDIELFTQPATSRETALAYLLTGANFDPAASQGAFSVGFWVLPRLFVSYGLGLFDNGNVLAARYELSRRWGLRASSGERDTGADISFIIDR